jgi:hypothetical protein
VTSFPSPQGLHVLEQRWPLLPFLSPRAGACIARPHRRGQGPCSSPFCPSSLLCLTCWLLRTAVTNHYKLNGTESQELTPHHVGAKSLEQVKMLAGLCSSKALRENPPCLWAPCGSGPCSAVAALRQSLSPSYMGGAPSLPLHNGDSWHWVEALLNPGSSFLEILNSITAAKVLFP